jgi:hypothetical protein
MSRFILGTLLCPGAAAAQPAGFNLSSATVKPGSVLTEAQLRQACRSPP